MRMHERSVPATARPEGELVELASPAPGLFRIAVRAGDVVRPGTLLGELEVLGQLVAVVAPAGAAGAVVAVAGTAGGTEAVDARPPVDYGARLVAIDPRASAEAGPTAAAAQAAAASGLVFRAPTSGRFYGRSAPDKPPFVAPGTELGPGATICLLEVMKTFHRVTYGGADLPERARVERVLVADGDDVSAGDPLLALE